MLRISFKRAIEDLRSAKGLGSQLPTAVARALNESILAARTVGRRSVKQVYNISQRYLSTISTIKATRVLLTAKVLADKTPIPLDAFSPKFSTHQRSITISRKGLQRVKNNRRRLRTPAFRGVSVEIFRNNRIAIPFAFMKEGGAARVFARGEYRKGATGGFTRRTKRVRKSGSDIPIKPLLGVSVYAAAVNDKTKKEMQVKVKQIFPVSLNRNVNYLLNRTKRSAG